jgi:NDP-sugar pyrophosphorylase family protein
MLINSTSKTTAEIDVLVLCGGAGSRLRPLISDRPKGMALIGGQPFLDILVDDLLKQGFQRIIFCVGHLKEQIIGRYNSRDDAEYLFSQEDVPLGTGGAVQNALPLVRSDPFLVMNGDSLCRVDFERFYSFHQAKAANASFVLTQVDERHDGGVVRLDRTQKVHSFLEKSTTGGRDDCFINAGIYLLQRESIEFQVMTPPFSLEYDIFPKLVNTKRCFGFVVKSELVDIGTPERYLKANEDRMKANNSTTKHI